MSHLELRAERTADGAVALVPHLDGQSLVELVAHFEAERGYEPAGGYAGIVPAYFSFGDLSLYYEGKASRHWPRPDHVWLLGCDCGEVGCWPLTSRVAATGSSVVWSHFQLDQRPQRDYTGFGPFIFDAVQYAEAVAEGIRASESEDLRP